MSEREKFIPKEEVENRPESIPTREEVVSVLEQLIGKETYTIARELADEKGLYLLEVNVTVPGEDGHTEYGYMRKGRHEKGGQASDTAIHTSFYDKDGEVIPGGTSVARYTEGVWVLIP